MCITYKGARLIVFSTSGLIIEHDLHMVDAGPADADILQSMMRETLQDTWAEIHRTAAAER